MTQKEKILRYLKEHGEITVKECIWELGITQGATRIKELIEDDNQPIKREKWRTVTRKDGTKTDVRVYEWAGEGQSELFGKPQPTHAGAYSQ